MRALLVVILLFTALTVKGQESLPDSGFTNMAEAKDELVNGVKQGKWVEYINYGGRISTKQQESSTSFRFIVYKDGKPYGIVREYDISFHLLSGTYPYKDGKINGIVRKYDIWGKLLSESPYINDKINGVARWYYKSGKVSGDAPYKDSKINGVKKSYYESGYLKSETPCADEITNGIAKEYYDSGRIESIIPYTANYVSSTWTKSYYENGMLKFEDIFDGQVEVRKSYNNNGELVREKTDTLNHHKPIKLPPHPK